MTTIDRLRALGLVTDGTYGAILDPDKVLAALAVDPARPGLDVEALSEALKPVTRSVLHDDIDKWRRETAAKVAAEYERLVK